MAEQRYRFTYRSEAERNKLIEGLDKELKSPSIWNNESELVKYAIHSLGADNQRRLEGGSIEFTVPELLEYTWDNTPSLTIKFLLKRKLIEKV
jgi:hypothetical protein